MNDRDALLQLYVWMGNSGMGKDHPWVTFIEEHLRQTANEPAVPTLRDTFAGQAMAALLPLGIDGTVDDFGKPEVAHDAYRYADAMLAERERRSAK